MKVSGSYGLLAGVLLVLSACSGSEEDKEAPSVSAISVKPQNGQLPVEAGDSIVVEALLEDDQELSSLTMAVKGAQGGNWNESFSLELSGTERSVNESLLVPSNTTDGNYHIEFRVLDYEGKLGEANSSDFEVVNNQKPQINLSIGSVAAGDTLKLSGTVADNKDLAHVAIRMDIPPGYSGDPLYYQEQYNLDGPADTLWDFQKDGEAKIYFPPFAKTGKYKLRISAADSDGNFTKMESIVEI